MEKFFKVLLSALSASIASTFFGYASGLFRIFLTLTAAVIRSANQTLIAFSAASQPFCKPEGDGLKLSVDKFDDSMPESLFP